MANLLTVEAKKKIINDRRFRQIVVALLFIEILFLVAGAFNLVLWLSFKMQNPSSSQSLSVAKTVAPISGEERQQAESKIFQLSNWWTTKSWVSFVEQVEKVQPPTIKINQITGLWSEKAKLFSLVISGQSINRQDLVKFVDSLRKEGSFSKVDLPIEYLLSSSQGRFTLNLEIKNND
ncbi:MAG: hypothetical protein WCV68_04310 [Candidatus Paceibacterota bacterium]|jgi:hypothetical protein